MPYYKIYCIFWGGGGGSWRYTSLVLLHFKILVRFGFNI